MENDIKAAFGLITDIQYADHENGISWDQLRVRYYRDSLNLTTNAINYWKNYETQTNKKLKFIIQLGDIIDTKAKLSQIGSLESMHRVLNKLRELRQDIELLHIWGNHEFYNFLRSNLVNLPLNTARYLKQNMHTNANYYTHDVTDNLTMICLDFYEFSVIGYENDTSNDYYQRCLSLLKTYNKNQNLNDEKNVPHKHLRYLAFNGGLFANQLDWLKIELEKCQNQNKKAIVCGHVPININASNEMNLAFNCEEISEILWSHEKTVIAYFSGHFHPGGYYKETRDNHSIHHITFKAIVETLPESNSFF